jgi:hypothetical protein
MSPRESAPQPRRDKTLSLLVQLCQLGGSSRHVGGGIILSFPAFYPGAHDEKTPFNLCIRTFLWARTYRSIFSMPCFVQVLLGSVDEKYVSFALAAFLQSKNASMADNSEGSADCRHFFWFNAET